VKGKSFLQLFFIFVLVVMSYGTVVASMDRNVVSAFQDLWHDPWFKVTLYDTYFAFAVFYLWLFYKESCFLKRILWFVLLFLLGNFTIAIYMLIQLSKMKDQDSLNSLLTRREERRDVL
jgi:hypothetical protein